MISGNSDSDAKHINWNKYSLCIIEMEGERGRSLLFIVLGNLLLLLQEVKANQGRNGRPPGVQGDCHCISCAGKSGSRGDSKVKCISLIGAKKFRIILKCTKSKSVSYFILPETRLTVHCGDPLLMCDLSSDVNLHCAAPVMRMLAVAALPHHLQSTLQPVVFNR